ncbi:hypothetical protein Droror1_Dr00004024 [Drosera rotundifolia]
MGADGEGFKFGRFDPFSGGFGDGDGQREPKTRKTPLNFLCTHRGGEPEEAGSEIEGDEAECIGGGGDVLDRKDEVEGRAVGRGLGTRSRMMELRVEEERLTAGRRMRR